MCMRNRDASMHHVGRCLQDGLARTCAGSCTVSFNTWTKQATEYESDLLSRHDKDFAGLNMVEGGCCTHCSTAMSLCQDYPYDTEASEADPTLTGLRTSC
jgi:hypothetical protein